MIEMRIDNLKNRLSAVESQIGARQLPTTDGSGQRCWLSIAEKDILAVYVDLLDIEAARQLGSNADIAPDVLDKLRLWSRVELPAVGDPLLADIRDRARAVVGA
jgi:hypothetical protein